MATIQFHPEPQGSYKSPYSFVSTYDKWPILDQGGIKGLDTTRSDEAPTHKPNSSHYLTDREQTIIELDSDTNDGFIDIDELLSDKQQKNITPKGMVEKMTIGFKSGISAAFSKPTEGSTQDLVIPSVNDFVTAEVDLIAISDSDPPHNMSSHTVDGTGLASGTTLTSNHIVTEHRDDDARLQLAAALLKPTSPGHGSVAHQASPISVNPEVTHRVASYDNLDVIQEAEDEVVDVFANNEDDADICRPKRLDSSSVSSNKSASDRNIFEPLASQHDSAQFPQLHPAAISLQQSDSTNDSLSRHGHQQDNTKIAHRKRLRTPVLTRPASTASPVSFAPGSNEFNHTQSVTRLKAPAQERESDTDQEMADDGNSHDSDDQDYDVMNDAAASEMRHSTGSRKRVKRVKDREPNKLETPTTQSLNVSCEAIAATSSVSMQESEEIPIRGSLVLKTVGTRVIYSLTFSQEFILESSGTSQRQPRSVSSSGDRRDSDHLSTREGAIGRPIKKSPFSTQEDDLLRQLKGEGISWDDIKDRFSDRFHERSEGFHERSKGTLQVHYSTKLKTRLETSKSTKKRRWSNSVD